MTNTNSAPDANNSLQVAFRLLDEMDYFLETLQEKLTDIKAMAREILAINHEHKADPVVLPVVDLRNKDYPHKRGS